MRAAACSCVALLLYATAADAQSPVPPAETARTGVDARTAVDDVPDCDARFTQVAGGHLRYEGEVVCDLRDGVKVFADVLEFFTGDDLSRIVASGHVVFTSPEGYIRADQLTYDTRTDTGTFETASGQLALGPDVDRVLFGGADPVVYFYGQRLERTGDRRYRVTRGGWTTCEQPTPRWMLTTGSAEINLDDYVVATNTVLRVKDVPLFWFPAIYYPIQNDNRATGFLMPTYGASTFRGQSISNAFFWAIDRSHDATFFHDWFTRAGHGGGVEYRYVTAPQSSGTFRAYAFRRGEPEPVEDGTASVLAAATSYEFTGTAVHAVAPGVIARARLDYFSDVTSQRLLHQDIYQASRRSRLIEGGLSAGLGAWSTNVVYQRNEVINGVAETLVYGGTPRASVALAPQRLFDSPAYASLTAEYAYLPYRRLLGGTLVRDDSFGRLDVAPSVRLPLSRLTFLSVNTSATYRGTYYTRQAGPTTGVTEPGSFLRQYATVRTDVVGPVLNRIWDLPAGGFAERLKHSIEPAFTVDVVSPIQDYSRTPVLADFTDFVVGGSTRVTYGLTNRLFTRSSTGPGARGTTREIVTLGVQQTYYTRAESSRYDASYVSGLGVGAERSRSPIALNLRVSPSAVVDANARVEYGTFGEGLQMLTTGAALTVTRSMVNVNYSRQRLDPTQPLNSFVSASARTTFLQNRLSTSYALSWDLARSYVVSQGVVGSYMAQCCGVQVEYQQFNYTAGFGLAVPTDRRFNISFVLAGVGTFSNFFGAFGG